MMAFEMKTADGRNENHGMLNGLTGSVRPVNRPIHHLASTRLHFLPLIILLISHLPMPLHSLPTDHEIGFPEWEQQPQTCQRIPDNSGCTDMLYNQTTMPNLVQQQDVREAADAVKSFEHLIQYKCSEHIRLFLCSVYFPMCTMVPPADTVIVVPPCRTLCLAVQEKCLPVMQEFGYSWPPSLDCNKFPEANKNDQMCMAGPISPTSRRPPNRPKSSRYPLDRSVLTTPPLVETHNCHPQNAFVRLNSSRPCGFACHASFITSDDDKLAADIVHGVVACFALLLGCTVFAVIVYTSVRLSPQERPVLYVIACTVVMSTGYLVRLAGGREVMGCTTDEEGGRAYVIVDGVLEVKGCIAVFILLYYFGMAANLWWLVMTMTWSTMTLSTPSGNSCQLREKLAHAMVWPLAAVPTIYALVVKLVDADELSATCSVGQQNPETLLWLHIFPLSMITILGGLALIRGYLLRRRQRTLSCKDTKSVKTGSSDTGSSSITSKRPSHKRELSDHFLLPKCAAFLPSAVIVIVLYTAEYILQDTWTSAGAHGLPVLYYFTRVLMQFAFGITLTIWTIIAAVTPSVGEKTGHKVLPHAPVYANVPPYIGHVEVKPDPRINAYESDFHSNDYASISNIRVPMPTEVSFPISASGVYPVMGHLHNNKLAAQQQNVYITQRSQNAGLVSSLKDGGQGHFV